MIVVKIASVVRRLESLKRVLISLRHQADRICVYQNDYSLNLDGVECSSGTDLGDAGKVWPENGVEDYVFLCDDDIIYPPNYCERMVHFIQRNGCIVGVHGAILKPPINNYFADRRVFHFQQAAYPTAVNVLGTGTVAYHASYFQIDSSYPKAKNMLDVFFAVKAQDEKKKMMIIGRQKNWLMPSMREDSRSLYQTRGAGIEQTRWINTVPQWSIF